MIDVACLVVDAEFSLEHLIIIRQIIKKAKRRTVVYSHLIDLESLHSSTSNSVVASLSICML